MASNYEKLLSKQRTEFIDNFWLNLNDTSQIKTLNTLRPITDWEKENPVRHLIYYMSQPENLGFTCRHLFGIELHPIQHLVLKELATKPFPMLIACRGFSKTFLLAVHSLLTAIFQQGSKVVVTAAAFRQSKHVFEYCENIWKNSPMLQDILSDDRMNKPTRDIDRCVFRIGSSSIITLPLGSGEKIRGQRATHLITEEFNSIPEEIFELVVAGFAAVSASPILNVKSIAKLEALKQLGDIDDKTLEEQKSLMKSNQSILSGTCGYDFENFAKYWKKYKSIIESRGDVKKLEEIFNGEIPMGFKWQDYSIIRIPFELMPEGFMDKKHVGKSKATMHSSLFNMEFSACFARDSQGFFSRSLIEKCVATNKNKIDLPSCGFVDFSGVMKGDYRKKYIMGVDPASEIDNFTIFILEIWPEHRRVVYGWSINKEKYKAKLKKGLTQEHDYYRFCAKKIRELKRLFPCELIAIDTQGGGYAIAEVLGDPNTLLDNEKPIYPVIDEKEERPTDDMPGEHILQYITFADALWVNEANHGLKKDMESQTLLFPSFDTVAISLALEEDKIAGRIKMDNDYPIETLYDTLEDCMIEIEELKKELVIIVHTKTAGGRDHWDTPELKIGVGKKGRLRKDRYTALLMSNACARELAQMIPVAEYQVYGGIATQIAKSEKKQKNQSLYTGPDWFMQKIRDNPIYGVRVEKNNGVF
mgnify:CR=1 FL=1